jgi:hypothetical protein
MPDCDVTLMTYAGLTVTRAQVQGTLALLRHYRAFLASDCERMRDPEDPFARYGTGRTMTKEQARRRLAFLIHTAINRRAGIPDVPEHKADSDHQRAFRQDQIDLQDWFQRRVRFGINRFRTRAVRERFQHLIDAQREDD